MQATRLKAFTDYETYGSIPIAYSLPKEEGERDVTVAIDDASGNRVRNLMGQLPRKGGENKELWDGLDDEGRPVAPGSYTATVVDHKPLEVKLVNSVYNAGTPPWSTENGRKLWGSNHGHPTTIATRKNVLLVGFTGVEGATGLLRAEENALIQWLDMGEVADVTLDDHYAYTLSRDSWIQQTVMRRFDLETGRNVPFEDATKSVHAVLPIPFKETQIESSLAVSNGKVYLLLIGVNGTNLVTVNARTGEVEKTGPETGTLVAITGRDEAVYGLQGDGTVVQFGLDGSKAKALFKAEVGKAVRLAVSQDIKRFAISDQKTNQVFIFDAAGKKLATIGKAYESVNGKRPAGKFVETDLIAPLGLDFDAQGRLWIAEAEGSCRRVSNWTLAGDGSYQLAHQYWGGADYGAMAGLAITFDSSRFIAHGVEFALDPHPEPAKAPTQEKPLVFHPELSVSRGMVYQTQCDRGTDRGRAQHRSATNAGGRQRAQTTLNFESGEAAGGSGLARLGKRSAGDCWRI